MATCPLCRRGALRIIAAVIQEAVITRSCVRSIRTLNAALADGQRPRLSHIGLRRGHS